MENRNANQPVDEKNNNTEEVPPSAENLIETVEEADTFEDEPDKKQERHSLKESGFRFFTLPVILILLVALRFIFDADKFLADLSRLFSIISFLVWGFAIAFFIDPLVTLFMKTLFKKMKKGKRGLAMLLAYLVFFGIITFLSVYILPVIGENIIDIASKVPSYWNDIQNWWSRIENSLTDDGMINHFLLSVGDRIGLLLSDYFNSSEFNRQLKDLGTGILNTALGATQFLIDFLLALVMSIYMLADKENMIRGIKRIVYAVFKKETADKAVFATKKTNEIFKKFFLGKGLASIIVGVVAFIFASLTKLPVPILQAAILGITNMVPTIGPVIGAVPCLLLTLLYSPVQALWLLIFILVVQQIDGMYLSPKILGDSLGLKPLFVIVGVLIGGSIAGILGALLGTPTLAVISYFLNRYTEKRLKEKQLNI
jgi:predicted PurR-regulated permease PerM